MDALELLDTANMIERTLYPRVGSDAEELADVALLRALEAQRRGQAIERGYLWRAATTGNIDRARRVARWREWALQHGPLLAHAGDWTNNVETRLVLAEWLGALDEDQRRMILMRLEGRTARQIAATLGICVRTAKKKMACAMDRLRDAAAGMGS